MIMAVMMVMAVDIELSSIGAACSRGRVRGWWTLQCAWTRSDIEPATGMRRWSLLCSWVAPSDLQHGPGLHVDPACHLL